ncbi:G-patch domain [Macleaya cordata]|uniref:G-patch domain n=1 Tax=Macleaya cordata TaxID=56857 RepID=A0A200QN11_MACCD|nr:G-patch domain [Macleaya cordata]
MTDRKGKSVGTLCNYTEETVNVLQPRPVIIETIPSHFNCGNRRVAYLLRKQRFFPGMGLGRCHQGITQPLESRAVAPEEMYGLGYCPSREEVSINQIEK